jgi:hypothetical protein
MRKQELIGVGLLVVCLLNKVLAAEPLIRSNRPTVTAAAVPLYPPLARAASVQGVVVLEVITAGDKADSIKTLSGPKLLAVAAASNLQSWRFVGNPPQKFQVVFRYTISNKCKGGPTVNLNLPSEVSVCSRPAPPMN